jgi:hypothetical protein
MPSRGGASLLEGDVDDARGGGRRGGSTTAPARAPTFKSRVVGGRTRGRPLPCSASVQLGLETPPSSTATEKSDPAGRTSSLLLPRLTAATTTGSAPPWRSGLRQRPYPVPRGRTRTARPSSSSASRWWAQRAGDDGDSFSSATRGGRRRTNSSSGRREEREAGRWRSRQVARVVSSSAPDGARR